MTSPDDNPLDPAALAQLRQLERPGRPSFMGRLIQTYLADEGPRRAAMRAALTSDDQDAIRLEAHSLKSSSRLLGAGRLADLCLFVEKQDSGHGLAQLLDQIDVEAQRVNQALRDIQSI